MIGSGVNTVHRRMKRWIKRKSLVSLRQGRPSAQAAAGVQESFPRDRHERIRSAAHGRVRTARGDPQEKRPEAVFSGKGLENAPVDVLHSDGAPGKFASFQVHGEVPGTDGSDETPRARGHRGSPVSMAAPKPESGRGRNRSASRDVSIIRAPAVRRESLAALLNSHRPGRPPGREGAGPEAAAGRKGRPGGPPAGPVEATLFRSGTGPARLPRPAQRPGEGGMRT